MTVVSQLSGHRQPTGSAELPDGPLLTLADEHMLLLRQVAARAADLLTAAGRGRWPAAELASLARYAQAEVLRHAAEEEALLFPASPSPSTTRLARDHVRLRAGAELLTRAAAGEQLLSPGQLATAIRDFVDQLESHMSAEEKLLGSGRASPGAPAVASLGGHPHTWYPLTEGPVIDLDALPAGEAVAAVVDRLLRLGPGEQAELQSSVDMSRVWQEMNELSPGGYQFISLEEAPGRWRMRVTRRQLES